MSEGAPQAAVSDAPLPVMQRLHPTSFLFLFARSIRPGVLPLVALVFFGREVKAWELWVALPVLFAVVMAVLRARVFRYGVGQGELVLREGLLDRTLRHIPIARIQHIAQRRQLPHRLLGVTELRLESASGGKPEAVMKVLGLKQAQALEALLHEHGAGLADAGPPAVVATVAPADGAGLAAVSAAHQPVGAQQASSAATDAVPELLHQLSARDIVRLGLASNRGMVMVGVGFGAVMSNDMARKLVVPYMGLPFSWVRGVLATEVAGQHWLGLLLGVLATLLAVMLLLRGLSVALAFFKYNGFTLQRQGGKLVATFGLSTHVRASARLSRLQRWQLDETLVHRWLGRCRLSVAVAGGQVDHGRHLEPGVHLDELAPIATPAQARALLKMSLPALDWDALDWQPLPKAGLRRLAVQARWVLPGMALALWLLAHQQGPQLPYAVGPALAALLAAVWLWHARAWGRFAAYAQAGEVLVHRSGVWHRRWVIVAMPRLQSLRLASTPLDRRLGVCSLQADTQGGSRRARALDVTGVPVAQGETLRAAVWARMA
jgi:putative membrane protein